MIAISLVFGLLAAGTVWLVSRPPRGEMVRLLPPPTLAPLIVHVSGAVAHPGVYSLPAGNRVRAAILAAGDTLPGAKPDAQEDGAKIEVPLLNPPTREADAVPSSPSTPPVSAPITGPININLASQPEFESLPEIGPVIAQRGIAYRDENRLFTTLEAIQNVSGIGPATYEKIRDLITVGAIPRTCLPRLKAGASRLCRPNVSLG